MLQCARYALRRREFCLCDSTRHIKRPVMQSPNPAYMANKHASEEDDRLDELWVSLDEHLQEAIKSVAKQYIWSEAQRSSISLGLDWHEKLIAVAPSAKKVLQSIYPSSNLHYVWTHRLRPSGKELKMKIISGPRLLHHMYFDLPPGVSYTKSNQMPQSIPSSSCYSANQPGGLAGSSSLPDITTTYAGGNSNLYSQSNSSRQSQSSRSMFSGTAPSFLSTLLSKASRASREGSDNTPVNSRQERTITWKIANDASVC